MPDLHRKRLTAFLVASVTLACIVAPAAVVDQQPRAGYIAFQAEDADAILNPDADNDVQRSVATGSPESPARVWTLTSETAALGGAALQAPATPHYQTSDTTLQESLALYRLRFQIPATYYLYCRGANNGVPGNAGTDSAWRPSTFGDDQPGAPLYLPNSGDYAWKQSGSYTVAPADVDQVLELHIGVRETLSRIDAFVLAVSNGLSDAQLDALVRGESLDESGLQALGLEYDAPFLTDADMRMYLTNTRGIIEATSDTAVFYHPCISGVRLAGGTALPVLSRGANVLRVAVTPGVHEIEIETADEPTTTTLWPEPRDPTAVSNQLALFARIATAAPGDEIVIANGVYSDWSVVLSAGGTAGAPVVVRPETPGGVLFRGGGKVILAADYLVLKGFRFDHPPTYVLEIDGTSHNRITQCQFFSGGAWSSTFSHTVTLDNDSHHNRLDHNYFAWMKSMSIGERVSVGVPVGTYNRFDHNIFRDIYRYSYNGQENIQLGQGNATSTSMVLATVEYNVFDNAWGDGETISDKSSGNTTRHNIAAHNRGAFTYRCGKFGRFEGNVIVDCSGGLRAYDDGHTIINNLIVGCSSYGISLHDEDDGHAASSYCLVANNTIVNCRGNALDVGSGDPARRPGNRFINNLLVSNVGQLVANEVANNQTDPTIDHNLLWATESAVAGPMGTNPVIADPDMTTIPDVDEYLSIRPSKTSPAIDAGVALTTVTRDRWQVGRPIGSSIDIGADEVDPSGDFATTIRLPLVPPVRTFDYDDYKHGIVATYDASDPLAEWSSTGGANATSGNMELTDTTVTLAATLPPSFVMEWEYQSDTYTAGAVVSFSGRADGRAYRFGLGGSSHIDRPAGYLSLAKDDFGEVLRSPDLQYHYMVYNSLSTAPDPTKWYRFRLLKRGGLIRMEMNCEHVNDEMVPILVWQDLGALAGDPLEGEALRLVQTGSGRWRNVRVWETAATPTPPRIVNTGSSTQPDGAIAVRGDLESTGGGDGPANVFLLLGPTDEGATTASWPVRVEVGPAPPGPVDQILPGLASGAWAFRFAARNSEGWGFAPEATSFTVMNTPPRFMSGPPLEKSPAVAGLSYFDSVARDATDPNGDTIVFAKLSGPSWLTIATDGSVLGTPDAGDVGVNAFTLLALDQHSAAATTTMTVRVSEGYFVRPGASGDGSSWANAASLASADGATGDDTAICIAGGVYDIGAWDLDARDGQSWLGGFPPTGSPGLENRDPGTWPTTLTAGMVSRSLSIMSLSGVSDVTVDGIVFTQVSTTGAGGGLSISDSEALVANCTFTSSTAKPGYWDGGAGIRILGSLPDVTVRDCIFSNNLIRPSYGYGSGAGLRAWGGNIRIERCLFIDNTAPLGAAVSTRQDAMTLTNCIFAGNRSIMGNEGGGALATRDATTTITHCTFHDNTTDNRGDVFIIRGGDRFHVANSIFADNGDTAIYATSYQPCTISVTNSLFHDHAIDLNNATYLTDYTGNVSTDSRIGGSAETETDPLFQDVAARDFRIGFGSPAIDAARYGTPLDYLKAMRPIDGENDGLALPDMGAFEMPSPPTPTATPMPMAEPTATPTRTRQPIPARAANWNLF